MVHSRYSISICPVKESHQIYLSRLCFLFVFCFLGFCSSVQPCSNKVRKFFGLCIWNLHKASSMAGCRNLTHVRRNPSSSFLRVDFILRQAFLMAKTAVSSSRAIPLQFMIPMKGSVSSPEVSEKGSRRVWLAWLGSHTHLWTNHWGQDWRQGWSSPM